MHLVLLTFINPRYSIRWQFFSHLVLVRAEVFKPLASGVVCLLLLIFGTLLGGGFSKF